MTKQNTINFPECRYNVSGFNIIDTQNKVNNGSEIYIRAILDSACAEYQRSKLTEIERLDIIAQLGFENLTKLLAECFRVNHKEHNAQQEASFTAFILTKDSKFLDDFKC